MPGPRTRVLWVDLLFAWRSVLWREKTIVFPQQAIHPETIKKSSRGLPVLLFRSIQIDFITPGEDLPC
jgi:hypothetical protein